MGKTIPTRAALAALACMGVLAGAAEPANVPYPAGYRDWAHVKSMVIEKGHPLFETFGGIHHIYANAPAIRGYRAGKFPDGSVLVFDLLEAAEGGNAVTEGKRKVLGVMRKDARRFKDTGAGDSRALPRAIALVPSSARTQPPRASSATPTRRTATSCSVSGGTSGAAAARQGASLSWDAWMRSPPSETQTTWATPFAMATDG